MAVLALLGSLAVAAPANAVVDASASVAAAAPAAVDTAVDSGIVKAAAVVGFNPENIISDSLFYDGKAMTAAEIQSFLDAKIGSCRNGKCLNVLNVSVSSRDAWVSQATGNLVCSALQGGTMRVSELIYRIQVACGVSAKVILVTLQKEQGLTTSDAPSDWNLQAAMGASCPDTAPCDPAYSGVGPQIVQGVRQIKIYKAGRFAMQPGVNYIGYNPNSACGGTNLNIQNYATAALYNYTPYQPNAASLAAGWGLGDGCSSYGNRNFYQYFADWFGFAEQPVVAGAIKARYDAIGGRLSYLGLPTANEECGLARGGCYQPFAGGYIFISPAGGVFDVSQAIRAGWGPSFEWGPHGYPTGNTTCGLTKGGCYQVFENAVIYSSAMGSYAVESLMQRAYSAAEAEWGSLGYPVAAIQCGLSRGGCYQAFEGGQIFRNPAGYAFAVLSDIRGAWAPDFEWGALGYPVGVRECGLTDGGCYQAFEGGLIFSAPRSGAHALTTDFAAAYSAVNAEYGVLGYPTTDRVCGLAGGGCYQAFQGGYIY
ncbi:LGFP repeat-containing protein, partial [uncultured Microbacterium sp.]|uniref:LGFP repeat-containing protein n=1 Tax=uncultured Microbacterium sp. TaxID=191216 RepID=UPI0037DC1C8F